MAIMVFDIETIPDIQFGRRLYDAPDLDDSEIAAMLYKLRRQEHPYSEFLPHYQQQIVTISIVLETPQQFKIWSLGEKDSSEKEIITRFFDGIDKFTPTLVSWNGVKFDLPVLHYRALLHGVAAPRYWEIGENDNNFRWNNYLNRYHERHLDLMDILASYQPRAYAPLNTIALMLGLPGKMGMEGSNVFEYYSAGKIVEIRNYCETDVLNTYLIFLRFQMLRGKLTDEAYQKAIERVQNFLKENTQPHWQQFLNLWI